MSWILQVLKFLRLVDDNNVLSITNIGMWVSLARLVLVSSPSYAEVGTFMLAAAAYGYKKQVAVNMQALTVTGTDT